MIFIAIERLLKVTPVKVLVPDGLGAVAYPSVLQVGPADSEEVDELTPKDAVSALSFAARPVSRSDVLIGGGALGNRGLQATPVLPVSKSAVLILAAVFAAACVATWPPTPQRYRLLGWPPISCGRTGSTAGCKLLMNIGLNCTLHYDRETAEGHAFVGAS